jgi:hypothetical protein
VTISKEILSIAVLLVVNMLLLAAAWGKLQQALVDVGRSTSERLDRIERSVGIDTGETAFMRRTECAVLDASIRSDLADVKARLVGLEKEVHTLVARGDRG